MISPADMNIIQIDITNDCFNRCANCSRFSGNHKDVYYMNWDTFRRACESFQVKKFKGMVGIIGGEPTLHPEFDRFIRYYDNVIPHGFDILNMNSANVNEPIDDICKYQFDNWNLKDWQRRGLWTSLGPGYAKHFELIRKVFEFQCINDHKSSIMHQVNTITRKELGIPDDEWEELRDNCWLQNNWSASITPKGAFFCEVAGALDTLFNGPGGWPIEKGWWERKPCDFKDQLHWCELCSFCLKTPHVQSHTNVDIVSPVWDEKLKEIGSTKKRIIFDINGYDSQDHEEANKKILDITQPYLYDSDPLKRVNRSTMKSLALNRIVMVVVCVGYSSILRDVIVYNRDETDGIVVVTEDSDEGTKKLCREFNLVCHTSDKKHLNNAYFNKGAMINEGIAIAKKEFKTSWILLSDADIILPYDFKKIWSVKILNPGTLYYAERIHVKRQNLNRYMLSPEKIKNEELVLPHTNRYPWGYFQLFNLNAEALRFRKNFYSEDYISAGYVDGEFLNLWPESRRHFTGVRLIHIEHGDECSNWDGIKS